jgi:hypothetical protein
MIMESVEQNHRFKLLHHETMVYLKLINFIQLLNQKDKHSILNKAEYRKGYKYISLYDLF